jgi:glycosyltransferase involved in cell wall biosynthesis
VYLVPLHRLSLCMIVKNEADCIGRCLNSVKDVVDEMIIVDTGSTDSTIDICRSYGAQVYSFAWNGSFADARNFGLNYATGDWILWMDADEEVDAKDRYKLRDSLYMQQYSVLNINLLNYYGDTIDPDKTLSIGYPRLFRNHLGLRFVGNIHEALNYTEVIDDDSKYGFIDIKIHHYGYTESMVQNKEKIKRNLTMLEKELETTENPHWIHYHIATEYTRLGQFQQAFTHVNLSILHFLQAGRMPPFLVYKLKYSILISTGSWDGAWPGIEKAVAIYPDYVDLRFFMGFIQLKKGMYQEAIETFDKCIDMGEDNLNYLILKGVGSFQAWYHKGLCYEKLDQPLEAVRSFLQACIQSQSFTPALEKLAEYQASQEIAFEKVLQDQLDEKTRANIMDRIRSYRIKNEKE